MAWPRPNLRERGRSGAPGKPADSGGPNGLSGRGRKRGRQVRAAAVMFSRGGRPAAPLPEGCRQEPVFAAPPVKPGPSGFPGRQREGQGPGRRGAGRGMDGGRAAQSAAGERRMRLWVRAGRIRVCRRAAADRGAAPCPGQGRSGPREGFAAAGRLQGRQCAGRRERPRGGRQGQGCPLRRQAVKYGTPSCC